MDVRDREADPSSRHPAASSRLAPHRTPNRFAPELIPELVPDPLRFTFKRSSEFTQVVLSLVVLSLIVLSLIVLSLIAPVLIAQSNPEQLSSDQFGEKIEMVHESVLSHGGEAARSSR
jgi:hypothetical protein